MNIQVFGCKKSFETQKAERFFKERGIKFQRIDIDKYGMSRGEIASVGACVGIENLIDANGAEYNRLGLKYIIPSETIEEMLFHNPKLIVAPVVRNGRLATIGYKPNVWKLWIADCAAKN